MRINNLASNTESSQRKSLKSEKGFTLVEIMIVLAILGSIFALLAGRFAGARDKAKIKEAHIQMGQIANALSQYNLDCGKYPQALEALKKADDCKNWGPTAYHQGKLVDPWNNPYVYELSGTDFTLKSYGKDGKENGSGFDKDIIWGEEEEGTSKN